MPPYDGDYDADLDSFTNRELRTIKQVSGGIAGIELERALKTGDQDAFIGFTYVVLQRSGKFPVVSEDILLDAPIDAIEFIPDPALDEDESSAEGNAIPEPPSEPESGHGADASSSGGTSNGSSDLPAPIPLPTGTQG